MIFVRELVPPKKMSGLSSFAISMDKYNPLVYESIISNLTVDYYGPQKNGPYYYYQRDGFLEISSVDLKSFLEQATKLDDIHLELYEQEVNKIDLSQAATDEELQEFKLAPLTHQVEAINFTLTKKNKWLLLDSMGLGKTGTIIYTADILKRRGLIDHCLIICCVNSIKENWASEISKFSNSSYTILGKKIGKRGGISYATLKERAKILKEPIEEFFIITNIEALQSEDIIKAIQTSKNNFGMIAVDEIHLSNNKNSQRGYNLLKLKADYKIASTGTLITNSPISSYLPLAWTENDHSILTTFRPQYEVKSEVTNQVIDYKNLDTLHEEIESCSLRRTLKDVRDDMPPKTVTYEYITLDKAHWEFYENIKRGVIDEAAKIELNSSNLLALTTRLRQAALCPTMLTATPIKSTKLERCCDLVHELMSQGEKVVILSNFKLPVYELANLLTEDKPLVITGDTPEIEVTKSLALFKTDPNYNILLGTGQKIGTGISLSECHYMILLDLPYTHSELSQWTDRIYRVNSKCPVYIKILLGKDTIDEHIREIVDIKRELADYLIDDKQNSSYIDNYKKIIKSL